ncbi:sulfate reduction electron transfer complex DsrMKJOP subunit DsrM [Desulforhabdus amnigena]|jgi:nitrate reductase gamma subunit|uniref:Nitrate reductase subunit gamma n=1 Tax=Desulforhabdus amnigena TaxID=40218 RepID=A0A9W6D277_9BACT|nr:sulfate reduction electron transfer complex DsrMKJOP subunit DsrM [Desulforhabdus amnigena]NLJ29184.1 sulfate reduction electron transfer complex DsrMKJOP subunit DsrM [Deltaproteobacteria bacterium]GLI32877.1 nitrate reductase subunit gamma [Desulforhabdus amnigena]
MGIKFSLLSVVALVLAVFLGVKVAGLTYFFGVIVPYAAIFIFIGGFTYRILQWGRSPVPFSIPTTAGQQKSLPWIKQNKLDNPTTPGWVVGRMLLEILLFRSLFRNTKLEKYDGPKLAYQWEKWLWLAGLLFHYSFLVIFIRHLRFFVEPVPGFVHSIERIDGLLQLGLPGLYITDLIFLAAVTYLFLRRVVIPQMRYISLPADYFPLFLLMTLGLTGVLMRYFTKVDVVKVKELAMGIVTFHPVVPEGIGVLFYIHFFLICTFFIYFPFSKLMHLGGVFLSPTRNMPNNSRIVRHINPWNYPVKVHTYAEYEDHFREKMIEAGLPVEKE